MILTQYHTGMSQTSCTANPQHIEVMEFNCLGISVCVSQASYRKIKQQLTRFQLTESVTLSLCDSWSCYRSNFSKFVHIGYVAFQCRNSTYPVRTNLHKFTMYFHFERIHFLSRVHATLYRITSNDLKLLIHVDFPWVSSVEQWQYTNRISRICIKPVDSLIAATAAAAAAVGCVRKHHVVDWRSLHQRCSLVQPREVRKCVYLYFATIFKLYGDGRNKRTVLYRLHHAADNWDVCGRINSRCSQFSN